MIKYKVKYSVITDNMFGDYDRKDIKEFIATWDELLEMTKISYDEIVNHGCTLSIELNENYPIICKSFDDGEFLHQYEIVGIIQC